MDEQKLPVIARRKPFSDGHNKGQSGHCLLYGAQTDGGLSLSVATLRQGSQAPLHIHSREDETFYVVEGTLNARVGDQNYELTAGDAIFLPRGVKHKLSCVSGEAKVIMLITPPGLENFFDEIDQSTQDGPTSPQKMAKIAEQYGVTLLSETD